MGSRLKENPDRTFYWFFEASCPIARDKDPDVLFQFPEDFNDEESRQTLPRFCFPYDIEKVRDVVAVQHFTFVLTDLEGCQRFGFCRLTSSSHTCLCMLSYLPWFEVFYKLLNNLADYLIKGQTNEMRELLAALYTHPLPLAVGSVTLQLVPYFIAPDPRGLPSIPESRNLTELVVAVDVSNLLQLYASMLSERRILILSSKLSTLTACVHALSALLYPMYWQHIFIPVLPPHLLDYCCAPMPFLIGVHSSLTERVRSRGLEDVVILNVDTNTIESPFEDLKKIPADVVSGLKLCLKRQAASAGVGVAKTFLRAQALLFGGYGDALKGNTDGQVMFCEEVFLDHRSPCMRQFLQSAVHLQLFKQFIDGRLELLNRGIEPDDLFEQEILQCGTAAGNTKVYHQLVGNLKKGGGALIKSKTHMYKSAKRGLRSYFLTSKEHVEILSLKRGNSVSGTHTYRRNQSDCLQSRLPITQHFGKSRPRRPVNKQGCFLDDENTQQNRDTWEEDWQDGAVSDPVADPELQEEEGGDSGLCDPEEMDLLGEIFDTLSARSSHDRGLLYGTRSLDLFGPDTTDYIRQRGLATPSQESLGVSIGGSGSLHSWNQEEGLHDMGEGPEQTEDPDWLGEGQELSETASETPQGRREDGRREEGRREEGVEKGLVEAEELTERKEVGMERWNVLRQGGQDERGMEERKKSEDITMEPEIQSECMGENGMGKEVEGEKESEEEERRVVQSGAEREKMQNDRGKDRQQGEENQGQERGPETPGELPRNRGPRLGTESRAWAGAVEDHQGEGDRLSPKTTDQQPLGQLEKEEKGEEIEVGRIPLYPSVPTAVALFQSPASEQTFHGKAQTRGSPKPSKPNNTPRSWDTIQKSCSQEPNNTHVSPNDSAGPVIATPVPTTPMNDQSEPGGNPPAQEDPPPVKVSELKKRFEA
ncbi:DENN domain-containing protein 1B isoform X2 [Coregonus clupeaformis]|uniref:DENN domain-containing protein 1B isoform X2 n=1 Tax=Coregonus clupeaformis TaxID=59861 RepID=UPI001E1C9545|nr:DENN domain-containing protein 1B isoform X2 [Coregonus clupeaformis]